MMSSTVSWTVKRTLQVSIQCVAASQIKRTHDEIEIVFRKFYSLHISEVICFDVFFLVCDN
jgi:hypothetical protein